ncbi:MAG: DNA polymerase III subunit alpha [Flavobacteriaceae bacterium]
MLLNTHTYYSLRYGVLSVQNLLETLKKEGFHQVALTDVNSTSASMDFLNLAPKYGIKPVLGVDFRKSATCLYVVLARSSKGYQKLNHYLSEGLLRGGFDLEPPPIEDTWVIYPGEVLLKEGGFAERVQYLAPHEFIGLRAETLSKLSFIKGEIPYDKLVFMQSFSFRHKKDFNTHRLLRAIDHNTLLSKLSAEDQGSVKDVFVSRDQVVRDFRAYPQILANTTRLLDQVNYDFNFSLAKPENQATYTANRGLDSRLLRKLAYKGIPYRYKRVGDRVLKRLNKELEIIEQKDFVSYFLINWKILKYARSQGYFYVGRGSGANSLVAYLLRITDVDPIELDLYFERFINLYRSNPPDFDLDFSWRDRDDVTRYIFDRFKHTALIAVYNTFKYRAAVRELSKVFGLPKAEIDRLSAGQAPRDELSALVLKYSKYIQGFPNYLGIHAGGIVIAQRPITAYAATFMPPKGYPTLQFDMHVAESIGLYKFDILSQRGLGKIKEAVQLVAQNYPNIEAIDIHDIRRFKQDLKIKHILRNAEAIGCFYVESPAMRMLLKKLQVDHYLGLVAASSVIRPGVAKSGMMRTYIERFRNPEKRKEAHPILAEIMQETYGVMVYQEDVIKVAHYFGGLSLGESDMLRRAMSGKSRSKDEFTKLEHRFFENCKARGHDELLSRDIWRQIASFAGYAFAKGHSASYAVESYQSLYLKAYFPVEYMVATVNNGGGFYKREHYLHEARMHGARLHPPCVNRGSVSTTVSGKDVYLGFELLHSFETNSGLLLLKERLKNGPFESLDDFLERLSLPMEQVQILIKIQAFRFTKRPKRALLWELHMKLGKLDQNPDELSLFKSPAKDFKTPLLKADHLENAFDQIEYLGFGLCHPFDLLKELPPSHYLAKDLIGLEGQFVEVYASYVTAKHTRTVKGEIMHFGTFLDKEGHFIDTVHFPQQAKQYPFRGRGVYRVFGKVVLEFDCVSIEVSAMDKLDMISDPRYG